MPINAQIVMLMIVVLTVGFFIGSVTHAIYAGNINENTKIQKEIVIVKEGTQKFTFDCHPCNYTTNYTCEVCE